MSGIPILVIGIGHRYRGDDAFGPVVISKLKALKIDGLKCIEHDGEPVSLIECWQGYDHVVLVDAVSSGAAAGTLFEFDLTQVPLPDGLKLYSTHAFGVAEAVELARVLEQLPQRVEFIGVEGEGFEAGTQLSKALEQSFEQVKRRILLLAD